MRKRFLSGLAMLFVLSVLSSISFAFTLPDTGKDGAYNIKTASFTDNGDGTIKDNVTGLLWQKGENSTIYNSYQGYTWYQASGTYDATYNLSSQNVCGSLSLAGGGWRLPTKDELPGLVDNSVYPEGTAGLHIDTTYFPNAIAAPYWSSDTFAADPSYASHAWITDMNLGYTGFTEKSNPAYVRCVRGGTVAPSCTYTISPTSKTFNSKGGPGTVTVTASSSTCAWTASESLSWVSVTSGSSGKGSGTVSYSVSKNTTKAVRTGNITIAGKTFAITQKK